MSVLISQLKVDRVELQYSAEDEKEHSPELEEKRLYHIHHFIAQRAMKRIRMIFFQLYHKVMMTFDSN